MTFELVNPHDPALIDASSFAVTVAAAMAMGGARFSIRDSSTGQTWRNGEAPEALFAQEAGMSPEAFLEANRAAVATALDTVTPGKASQLDGRGLARTCAIQRPSPAPARPKTVVAYLQLPPQTGHQYNPCWRPKAFSKVSASASRFSTSTASGVTWIRIASKTLRSILAAFHGRAAR